MTEITLRDHDYSAIGGARHWETTIVAVLTGVALTVLWMVLIGCLHGLTKDGNGLGTVICTGLIVSSPIWVALTTRKLLLRDRHLTQRHWIGLPAGLTSASLIYLLISNQA